MMIGSTFLKQFSLQVRAHIGPGDGHHILSNNFFPFIFSGDKDTKDSLTGKMFCQDYPIFPDNYKKIPPQTEALRRDKHS
jgi:hypothetical protein